MVVRNRAAATERTSTRNERDAQLPRGAAAGNWVSRFGAFWSRVSGVRGEPRGGRNQLGHECRGQQESRSSTPCTVRVQNHALGCKIAASKKSKIAGFQSREFVFILVKPSVKHEGSNDKIEEVVVRSGWAAPLRHVRDGAGARLDISCFPARARRPGDARTVAGREDGRGEGAGSPAALETLREIKPRSELEAMLATQMLSVNNVAMDCLRRARPEQQTPDGFDRALNQAVKVMNLYQRQLAALTSIAAMASRRSPLST